MKRVEIWSKVKEVRSEKGISVRELAQRSGVSKNHISAVENDKAIPTLYVLCLLAYALSVRPENLFDYEIYDETVPV